jgi:hypothetical protein
MTCLATGIFIKCFILCVEMPGLWFKTCQAFRFIERQSGEYMIVTIVCVASRGHVGVAGAPSSGIELVLSKILFR